MKIIIKRKRNLCLNFGSYVFPIKLVITEYEELVSMTKIISADEAKQYVKKD